MNDDPEASLANVQKVYRAKFGDDQPGAIFSHPSPLQRFERYKVSKAEAEAIEDTEIIWGTMIAGGHIVVVCAPPGGGKTTLLFHVASELSCEGHDVVYINSDIGAGDAKYFVNRAEESGMALLLPDLKQNLSAENVLFDLQGLVNEGRDCSGMVFVLDTLKKFCDVINKSHTKKIMKLFRQLTGRGATVILLAHTNKYRTTDGELIFEGTGDLKSDADELIYLVSEKNPDGSLVVSTKIDKSRAPITDMTFNISPDREVTILENHQDIVALKAARLQISEDGPTIEAIREALESGETKQADIIRYCQAKGISRRNSYQTLKRHCRGLFRLWEETKLPAQNNACIYSLVDGEALPPENCENRENGEKV